MTTLTSSSRICRRHPQLSEAEQINFLQWKQQMTRRFKAAQRLEPYEHRPWDRGFNIHEGGR